QAGLELPVQGAEGPRRPVPCRVHEVIESRPPGIFHPSGVDMAPSVLKRDYLAATHSLTNVRSWAFAAEGLSALTWARHSRAPASRARSRPGATPACWRQGAAAA